MAIMICPKCLSEYDDEKGMCPKCESITEPVESEVNSSQNTASVPDISYKVSLGDRIGMLFQNIMKWFTPKKALLCLSIPVLLSVLVILISKFFFTDERRIRNAFKATYNPESVSDSFGLNDDIGFHDLYETFMKSGGIIDYEIDYSYSDNTENDNKIKKQIMRIEKDTSKRIFNYRNDIDYNGSCEKTYNDNSSYTMTFNPKDGSSYKEYSCSQIIGNDDYTYFTYDGLNTWFRIDNENIIKNYNKSVFGKNTYEINDSLDFNLNYFGDDILTFNDIGQSDSDKSLLNSFVALKENARIDSVKKAKIKVGSNEKKAFEYSISIPKNDIRIFLKNVNDTISAIDYYNTSKRYLVNDYIYYYTDILQPLYSWSELAGKVNNDAKATVYISAGKIVKTKLNFFINDGGTFHSIDLNMDNCGDENVLDKVNLDMEITHGDYKINYTLSREKKEKKDRVDDKFEYCRTTEDTIGTNEQRNTLNVSYDRNDKEFEFEYLDSYYGSDNGDADNKRSTEYSDRYNGDGHINKTKESTEFVIDNCNVYSVFENNYIEEDERNGENEYSFTSKLSFNSDTSKLESSEIDTYTDYFSLTEKEYIKTLEDNAPEVPGHGLRGQLFYIYDEKDKEQVNKIITDAAFNQFSNSMINSTDGFPNNYLALNNLLFGDNKISIMAPYDDNIRPVFSFSDKRSLNKSDDILAFDKMMRNYVANVNSEIALSNTALSLKNIGYYKNVIKNKDPDYKGNEPLYIYIKPVNYENGSMSPIYEVNIYLGTKNSINIDDMVCIGSRMTEPPDEY